MLAESSESKKYIALNVLFQIIKLGANIVYVFSLAHFIRLISEKNPDPLAGSAPYFAAIALCAAVRFVCSELVTKTSFLASADAKKIFRKKIYDKLCRLGASYHEKISTGEVVQVYVEGVDQLETYFGKYMPQFFYAVSAPLILFAVLSFISVKAAAVLFVCVPLIPVSIVLVQKLAKNLLKKYWGKYTQLGDTFLENIQGLTTLKIYQADEERHKDMNVKAEEFRFITMKVLTMQLNSIIIMDIIAYGGAALGVIFSVSELMHGSIEVWQAFVIIMLSADFFLPMRMLGSYFHVAMNGMAASDKMFALFRLDEDEDGSEQPNAPFDIEARDLTFSYDGERNALDGMALSVKNGSLTAIVGESGCGKSTLANLLTGTVCGYSGSFKIGGTELYSVKRSSLSDNMTYVGSRSFIFSGTVRSNLLLAKENASDSEMTEVLKTVRLWDILQEREGLDTLMLPEGANLSGGQRQKLALARALLHDTPVYIFDEATSNIDAESEQDIMNVIVSFKGRKTVIMITHRLENAVGADEIYVMDAGKSVGRGTHSQLLAENEQYKKMHSAQAEYESYAAKGGA